MKEVIYRPTFYVWSVVEISLLIFVIQYTTTKVSTLTDIFIVIAFVVLLTSFILKKGIISYATDTRFWGFCGKYTYAIYIIHFVLIPILAATLWTYSLNPYLMVTASIAFMIGASILSYYIVTICMMCGVKKKNN